MVRIFSENQIDDQIINDRISERKQKIAKIAETRNEQMEKYESSLKQCSIELQQIDIDLSLLRTNRQDKIVDDIPTTEIDLKITQLANQKVTLEDKIAGLQGRIAKLDASTLQVDQLLEEIDSDEMLLLENETNRLKDSYNEQAKTLSETVKKLWNIQDKRKQRGKVSVFSDLGDSVERDASVFKEIPKFLQGGMYSRGNHLKLVKERFIWHHFTWNENPNNLDDN